MYYCKPIKSAQSTKKEGVRKKMRKKILKYTPEVQQGYLRKEELKDLDAYTSICRI